MTTGGWINMLLSVGFVTVLFLWCVRRVLFGKAPKGELGHIEPLDEDEVERR
jgi:hypothetical protein